MNLSIVTSMEKLHVRLNLDVSKSYITGREGILKLVNLQSFVAKCCKMRKI